MDKNATQWMQGPGPLANHDVHLANAVLSFVPIANATEALRLLPRVPTLRAHRPIKKGEEILFNYGSSIPFASHQENEDGSEGSAESEEEARFCLAFPPPPRPSAHPRLPCTPSFPTPPPLPLLSARSWSASR